MALFQDRSGRFHRGGPSGAFAKADEVRRARKVFFSDAAGRQRAITGKAARGRAVKVAKKHKHAKTVRAEGREVFFAKDRSAEAKKLAKKRGVKLGKLRTVQPRSRKVRREKRESLEKLLGVEFRESGDFATLVELEAAENTLATAFLFVADPYGESAQFSVYQEVRRAAHELLTPAARREPLFAVTIKVQVGKRTLTNDVINVNADTSQLVGGIVAAIFSALNEAGYYASDGEIGEEQKSNGFVKAKNLTVDLAAVRLRGVA